MRTIEDQYKSILSSWRGNKRYLAFFSEDFQIRSTQFSIYNRAEQEDLLKYSKLLKEEADKLIDTL